MSVSLVTQPTWLLGSGQTVNVLRYDELQEITSISLLGSLVFRVDIAMGSRLTIVARFTSLTIAATSGRC